MVQPGSYERTIQVSLGRHRCDEGCTCTTDYVESVHVAADGTATHAIPPDGCLHYGPVHLIIVADGRFQIQDGNGGMPGWYTPPQAGREPWALVSEDGRGDYVLYSPVA